MSFPLTRVLRRLFRHQPVIVVSGLPRSGTSMLMRMLDAGGVDIVTDGVRRADVDNPHSYFEFERVKQLHRDPDKSWLADCRGKAVKIVSFFLKDLPGPYHYAVIFMRRDLRELIASQNVMLARRGESSDTSDERMETLYREHLEAVGRLLAGARHFRTLEVDYRDVVAAPLEHAQRIAAFLGRPLDVHAMAAAVDAELYRNRA
jgi:hypothetical protein